MAITWDCNITNVNVTSKRADVRFTRTDSESSLAPWTHSYNQAIIETTQQRTALLNQVWDEWQNEVQKQADIDNFITNLEQTAKSNLEARET